MPNAKRKSANLHNTPIEVLSDGDDNENNNGNEQNNSNSHPIPNSENNDTRISTVIHAISDPSPVERNETPSSPTAERLSTDTTKDTKQPNEEIVPTYQHLIDQLIQYPAPMEGDDSSEHHHHHHHHHHNLNHNSNHHHDDPMVTSHHNDNDNDNNDNDNINDNDNDNDEALTFLPMPAYERSYRTHILRPINAIAKQQNQITGERNAEIILGDVRRRLNPVFRALYNSAWKHYSPLSSSSNGNVDGNCDFDINAPPLQSLPAWSVPGIPPVNPTDVDDEPFVLVDQPGAVFADAAAEALTKTKLLPQTIRSLLKLGSVLRDKSYLVGSSEDVVACVFLDFLGMMCAMLRLGDVDHNNLIDSVDTKIESIDGGKEENARLNVDGKEALYTTSLGGLETQTGTDKPNIILVPNLLEYIGNSLLSVTARILTQEACHSGYTQSLFLMRNKNGGRVPVDEAVRNFSPAFYRTHLFDSERDRVEMDEEEAEYLSPLRSGEWRDYYALYHPETSACEVVKSERDRGKDPLSLVRCQNSRHLIAATRYFVQGKALESLVHLVSSGITGDCGIKLGERAHGNIAPSQRQKHKRPHNDQFRRMERASVTSVFPTLDIFRSVAFLSRFYCSNGAENNGGDNDCLSPLNLRATLEAFRNTISQFIGSLEVGVHITTVDDRQNILSILSSIEARSMTEEEWQKTSTISTSITEIDKSMTASPATVRIVPFVDFTFSESSEMKMTMLWKFLTGCNGNEKRRDGVAIIVPSLQCQIQGLNELISWLNSLENDVREYKAQHTMDSKKELEKSNAATCNTPMKNGSCDNNAVGDLEDKRGNEGAKNNGVEVIEVEVAGVNLVASHAAEVPRHSDTCDFTEPPREDDDVESTEVCCNSNASMTSVDHCPELSSLSIEGSGVCWPKDSGSSKHGGDTILSEAARRQSWHQQDTSASKSTWPLVLPPRNDTASYKIFDLLQQRLLAILSQLRSSDYPILEHLFSPNGLHSELLKRTLPLLIFFTRHRKLQKNDIKLMWEASRFGSCSKGNGSEINDNTGKQSGSVQLHESVTSAIFDLILGLVNTGDSWILLGVDIFSYLANLFSQVRDYNWWTAQSLSIVESVVHHSIDAIIGNILLGNTVDDCVVPAGMDVLWSLSQDGSAIGSNTQRREITDTAFPMLMRVVERILTCVRDEFALCSKRIENSKVELGNGINVYRAPVEPSIRASNNTAIVRTRLAMQRLQTYFIRRSMAAIDTTDGSSCPTSTIRIMLCMMNFIPLQVETASSENINAENTVEQLLLSTENILQHHDLGAILINEMIHFADAARVNAPEHSLTDNSAYDGRSYSHSDCVNFRLKLFRLTFTRCVQLHFLALQNMSTHTNPVIPIDDVPMKKRKRGLLVGRQCDDSDRTSKRPILISTEDYEMNDQTSYNSEKKCEASSPQNVFLDLNILHPTPVEISKIWLSLISNGLTNKTVDHTFDLLYCLLSQDFGHRSTELGQWKEELARTIYPLCCKLHPPNISKAGYKLFIYCLGFMNVADGNFALVAVTQEQLDTRELSNILLGLSHGQESKQTYTPCCLFRESEPYTLDICSYQLCGLSILWSIILKGCDENVADMCMVYMAVLNAYSSINSGQQISFVQQCMAELNEEGSGNAILMKKKRMLRLIRLYTEYTMRSSCSKTLPHSDISHGHYAAQVMNELHTEDIVGSTLPYNIHIDFLDGPRFKVYCPSGMNTTVAYVRKSIWHHFTTDVHLIKEQWPENGGGTKSSNQVPTQDESRFNGKEFRLIFNGSELRDDMMKIGTLRIFENLTVYCCPRMCTENIKKKAAHVVENTRQKEKGKIKDTLSITRRDNGQGLITPGIATLISPTCIDSFFSLFSPEVCDDPEDRKHLCALVWDLLQLLPTEPQLRKGFQSIGTHHQTSCGPIPWGKWLPTPGDVQSAAHFRLLYGLQLIEAFVLHHEGRQNDVAVNESPKSLTSLDKDSGDGASSDDDVIIVKELKCNLKASTSKCKPQLDDQNIIKKRAYVVMDDDDFSPSKRHLNVVEENDSFVFDSKHNHDGVKDKKNCGGPRQWCKNFVLLGGLQHLVHLFTSIDLSLLSPFVDSKGSIQEANGVNVNQLHSDSTTMLNNLCGKDVGSLPTLMACVNKALFLIRIISTHASDNNGGNFIKEHLGRKREVKSRSDTFQLLHHLFKMVYWAVEFQNFCQSNDKVCSLGGAIHLPTQAVLPITVANSSTFLESKNLSSVEVGASVAIQCLFLVRMLSQTTGSACDQVSQQNLVLDYCVIEPNIDRTAHPASLSDAMVSSIVKSPSPHVRSLALSVFRSLLCLRQLDRKCMTVDAKTTDRRLKSFALSVLISLLPIGRGTDSEGNTHFEIISRTSVIFDMVSSCLSDIWLHTCAKMQQGAVYCFMEYFQGDQFVIGHEDPLQVSTAPTITGVQHLCLLFAWLVKEVNSLNPREFKTFSAVGDLYGKHCDLPFRVMVDSYLVGLLSLMLTVVKILDNSKAKSLIGSIKISETKVFLHLLFDKCAFLKPMGKNHMEPSSFFVSSQARDGSLELMRTLCTDCRPNLVLLLTRIHDQFYSGPPRKDLLHDWNVDLASNQKSVTGHVGMKNQGATCYLNSLLQQFFHTPALREGLLSCDLQNISGESVTLDSSGEGHKLLYELQLLFGNLLLSEKKDFDTSELVKSIRGYDGNPIRPGEQQDVDEFFNLFCDRLETALKPFPQRRLLHNVFGGQLSHLITCQQCNRSSERVEDFLSISLDVKGKKHILESLDLYIQGEVLDGSNKYFCSFCKEKRESIKRCCIKTLPNVLICHLKRFEFDLETLRKVKVNDRCEFPLELNMKKYTKECMDCASDDKENLSWRTDNYYSYNLRGVLVHTGTADSGHYYSLAQVRQKATTHQGAHEDQWFCFNDSTVTPFDSATLEATTFGGSLLTENSNLRPEERGKIDLAKSYSAYLLIYDRNESYTFDDQVKCRPCADPVMSAAKDCSHETLSLEKHGWGERITYENNSYIRDQTLFAPAYSYFLIALTEMSMALKEDEKPDTLLKLEAIQLLTCHWLENLVHAKDRSHEVEKIISNFSVWYESSLEACSWFLEKLSTTHQIWVEKILLHCCVLETRCAFVKLLSVIFQRMAPLERTTYFCERDTSVNEKSNSESTCDFDSDDYMIVRRRGSPHAKESISRLGRMQYWKSKSILARFVGVCLLDKLEGCDVHWRRFDQLFESILAFSSCGHEEACFLIRCGTILRLVDIYLEQNSTVPQKSLVRSPFLQLHIQNRDRRVQMGDKYKKPNFFPLLKLLCNLVCSAMVVPDDDNVSDSDASDTDSEVGQGYISCNGVNDVETSYLTALADQAFDKTKMNYELPQRDGWQVSRPDLFEKMLDEPVFILHLQDSQRLSCASSIGKRSRTSSLESQNDVTSLICKITCHVCCDNFELSLRICSFAKTLLEERKADEFNYALSVLLSMFHIEDKHFKERIPCALSAICTGIEKNSAYEKETVHLLHVLKNELGSRQTSDVGTEGQAICHENILNKLDDIILPLIPGENATFAVKQSVVSLIRSLLPSPMDTSASRLVYHGKYSSNAPDDPEPDSKRVKPHIGQGVTAGSKMKETSGIAASLHVEVARADSNRNADCQKLNTGKKLHSLNHYLDEEEIKDKIFSTLKNIFDTICETVASQSNRTARTKNGGITTQGRNRLSNGFEPFIVDSAAFFEYFEALRICLSGAQVRNRICDDTNWIFEVSGVLFRLLWKIDDDGRMEKRPSADTTKGEVILLIEFILEINPSQCIRALQNDPGDSSSPSSPKDIKDTNNVVHDSRITNTDPTTKMLEMYVTNSPSNADYNDRYMAHYYNILLRLADCNEDFCHAMLSHDNWRWALKSFVLSHTSSDTGKLYSVILNGTLKYVGENIKFREAIFRQLIKMDGKDSRSSIDQERIEIGSIKLLVAIFDGESKSFSSIEGNSDTVNTSCISHFVQGSCGGMSKLSLVFKKSITTLQEADSKQLSPGITVLKSLSLCLQCMCLTLSSFGINRVREIMQDCWPEVDDVNFMLTQIRTRTDNEWEQSYEVSSEAKLIVMQIITQASEVLTILASVEAAVQAVAE